MSESLVVAISVLVVLGSLGLVVAMLLGNRRLLPIEEGETAVFSAAMGGKIGWVRYNGPILHVRIYERFLVIGRFRTPILIHFDEIEQIEVKKWLGLIENGVQIHHYNPDAPRTIILGSMQTGQLYDLLTARLP